MRRCSRLILLPTGNSTGRAILCNRGSTIDAMSALHDLESKYPAMKELSHECGIAFMDMIVLNYCIADRRLRS